MNLQVGNSRAAKQRRHRLIRYWEHQVRGFHLTWTLELFILLPLYGGSLERSKLAPFILSSWIHLVSALLSLLSPANCLKTFQYLHNFIWTKATITFDVTADRVDGIHHFLQMVLSSEEFTEDINRMVRKKPWNTKKKQHNWKISLLMVSILVSLMAIRRPKRSSSRCQSLRSKMCPGLSEISVKGWCCIADTDFRCWCSSSTGISTMWASLDSAITQFSKPKGSRKSEIVYERDIC